MRVVAIILALAAGASGCSCSSNESEEQCTTTCGEPCMWLEPCVDRRRNLRFGAAAPGCCVDICGPTTRRLTTEEIEERRLLCD